MDLFESNLVIGRLGITTETHAGSAMVLVEKTMENAGSRTGIARPNSDESFQSDELPESMAEGGTSRLGLIPDEFEALDVQCDSATAVAEAVEEDIGLLASFGVTPPTMHAKPVDQADEAMMRLRQEFCKPKPASDEPAAVVPPTSVGHQYQTRSHDKKARKKATFRLPSETVSHLRAYSKVTGQWQYSLVSEALDMYLAKTSTDLDVESAIALREMLNNRPIEQ